MGIATAHLEGMLLGIEDELVGQLVAVIEARDN
jgi:hypothetical protein